MHHSIVTGHFQVIYVVGHWHSNCPILRAQELLIVISAVGPIDLRKGNIQWHWNANWCFCKLLQSINAVFLRLVQIVSYGKCYQMKWANNLVKKAKIILKEPPPFSAIKTNS